MKRSDLIKKYRNRVQELGVRVYVEELPYQVDIYLYPDGTVDDFHNPGGNSWLDDDHIRVLSICNEYIDDRWRQPVAFYEELVSDLIDMRIEEIVLEENQAELEKEMWKGWPL